MLRGVHNKRHNNENKPGNEGNKIKKIAGLDI